MGAPRTTNRECVGWNERRDICLIFSGEDFDLERKTATLVGQGARSWDRSGILVQLYEEFGAKFIADLNGRFSGVLIDLRTDTVHAFQ